MTTTPAGANGGGGWQGGYGNLAPAVTRRAEDKTKIGAMNDLAMIFFDVASFFLKVIITLFGAILMILLDFRRYKKRYGKRTFFQYSLRLARAEMEAEDPPLQHAAKTTLVAVWFLVFSMYFLG
ncbi:hypothetical protein [Stappia indica]|uniref:Uncharacterized protein n=1 Tax=Stappia indica TaxID=538381 RepID=A0A857C3Z3_9HYPH|nr:hypothetical protein [Stappia indica]QGZ33598.1 hypothetical protein GH266_03225 [Stappia indica]